MNGSLYITDPHGENLQPQGCLHGMWIMAVAVALTIALCLLFPACKTVTKVVTVPEIHTEYVHDTISHVDSIYQSHTVIVRGNCEETHDTIFKFKFKEKIVESITVDSVPYPVEVEVPVKYVPAYYKRVSTGFWILLAILVIIVGWKAVKIYLKYQSGGILK